MRSQIVSRCDPPKGTRPPAHHYQARGETHRPRPSASGSVGGRLRGPRSAPFRGSQARGSEAAPSDRADPSMDARRGPDVSIPRCWGPCDGRGTSAERSPPARRIRGGPGSSRGSSSCARARRGGLRDQGGAGRSPRPARKGRSARTPMAARTATTCHSRTRPRRSTDAKRHLLVSVRRLTATPERRVATGQPIRASIWI